MNHDISLSRRALLRNGAALGAGAALTALPFGAPLLAQGTDAWPRVEALIAQYVDTRRVANMVAALGQGQQDPVFLARGTDGLGSQRLSDADSLYRIYSMTKPITGMAAMMLVDEGKLGLDQPLAEILPQFGAMQVQTVYDGPITPDNLAPAVRPITIRMLLTHTSGLGYGIVQSGPIAQAYLQRGLVPGVVSRIEVPGLFRGKPIRSLSAFVDGLAQLPLVYQPGTRWSYSVGLDVMGRVIEVVSGQSFDAFLQQRIFDPVGMPSTFFQVPEREVYRLTTNYLVAGKLLLPIDLPQNSIFLDPPPFPFGGSGLVSSPRDYDRFLQMLAGYGEIEGRRVMSEAAVRLGTSNLLPDTLDPADPFARDFAFGAGGRVGRGAAEGIYGWFGAAGTAGLVDMRNGLRHSLFTQYMPSTAYPVPEQFTAAVAADAAARANA
ncbi:serine hydrolase domain-containing protein [Altericroceibacterium xinjiangense]|uniref:serine hydrolase domain-containing protein n=1 Tax=Altericroceibacterium xinjiangense TaxID=762261 RepID=UPI000F7EC806|nr:serine hydrolase domain-containing protein [Altericroceibacterium xinjiangense]